MMPYMMPDASYARDRALRGNPLLGAHRLDLDCIRVERAETACVQRASDDTRRDLSGTGRILESG